MGTAIKISTGLPVLEDLAWMETTNLTPEELNSRVINKGIIPALREMGHDVKTDRFSAEGGEFYILDTDFPNAGTIEVIEGKLRDYSRRHSVPLQIVRETYYPHYS